MQIVWASDIRVTKRSLVHLSLFHHFISAASVHSFQGKDTPSMMVSFVQLQKESISISLNHHAEALLGVICSFDSNHGI